MNKGFTLLELIVVIIIIGVLATLGFTQYQATVEHSRTAEARMILGTMRTAQVAYELEHGDYAAFAELPITVPGPAAANCQATHYFWYNTSNADGSSTATRCIAGDGGKPPDGPAACDVTLDVAGNFGGSCT